MEIKKKNNIPSTCRRCGTQSGVITKYHLYYCRHCFREVAKRVGFRKYN